MYCEHSFISEVNGYRYCGDPVVHKSHGYNPYCPDNPNNAFRCPLGFTSHVKTIHQASLLEFMVDQSIAGGLRQ